MQKKIKERKEKNMETLYACCERCKKVEEYHIYGDETDFPRGHLIVCGNKYDALTTGFKTEQEAQKYLDDKIAAQNAKDSGQRNSSIK